MENSGIDTYIVEKKSGIIVKSAVIYGAVGFALIALIVAFVAVIIAGRKAAANIKLIDRQGSTYTASQISEEQAHQLQARAFLLGFAKLFYAFDKATVESNVNRALTLGDESLGNYAQRHAQPNGIYQSVRAFGRVAQFAEQQFLENTQLGGNQFRVAFVQTLSGSGVHISYRVTISGELSRIVPMTTDNPNGYFIVSYVEQYEQL